MSATAASARVADLATRLGSPPVARDRTLPVEPALADLFPEGGLVRGRVTGCGGPAAWTLALATVAAAARAGAWVAVVGAPAMGFEAADGLGVPLERIVVVDIDRGRDRGLSIWAERVAAAADGFEIVLTAPPAGAERVVRRVRQRLQSNGVVLVAVDPGTPSLACDLDLVTSGVEWFGLQQGWGHLTARRATVTASGRRAPRPVARTLWLPGPDGHIAPADETRTDGARTDGAVLPFDRAG